MKQLVRVFQQFTSFEGNVFRYSLAFSPFVGFRTGNYFLCSDFYGFLFRSIDYYRIWDTVFAKGLSDSFCRVCAGKQFVFVGIHYYDIDCVMVGFKEYLFIFANQC